MGLGLLFYGFGAYGFGLPGADLSSLMLIYGFPISILGFALNYAQVGGHGREGLAGWQEGLADA